MHFLRRGEIAFAKKEHTNWLSNTEWSALKTNLGVTLYRLNSYTEKKYLYTHICECNNNQERGHEFEREQRTVYDMTRREKWCEKI